MENSSTMELVIKETMARVQNITIISRLSIFYVSTVYSLFKVFTFLSRYDKWLINGINNKFQSMFNYYENNVTARAIIVYL